MWDADILQTLAVRQVPDAVLGRAKWLIDGDFRAHLAGWWADGICDANEFDSYESLLREVVDGVVALGLGLPVDEEKALAIAVGSLIWQRKRASRRAARRSFGWDEKRFLWDLAGREPRCWICGWRFPEASRAQFLAEEHRHLELPPFVDVLRPRGRKLNELRIEIDHVVPLAAGGMENDNLRLACGWCNRSKSRNQVLYDASGKLGYTPSLGGRAGHQLRIPQPFWTVRLLALRRRCEHPGGCAATSADTELTVAPIRARGAPTPTNLQVTCYEHDPLGSKRLVSRHALG